jgi:hypothetical protein
MPSAMGVADVAVPGGYTATPAGFEGVEGLVWFAWFASIESIESRGGCMPLVRSRGSPGLLDGPIADRPLGLPTNPEPPPIRTPDMERHPPPSEQHPSEQHPSEQPTSEQPTTVHPTTVQPGGLGESPPAPPHPALPLGQRRALGAVAGLVAACCALAVAEAVAATSRTFQSPVLDVGDRVVDGVPRRVKELAIN